MNRHVTVNRDNEAILKAAREHADGTIDAVIDGARALELQRVLAWLRAEGDIAYARRSFTEAHAFRRAAARLQTLIHRTGKD